MPLLPETVADAFPPPPAAERVEADAFGDYLRQRSLHPVGTPVRRYDGVVLREGPRVVDLPLVPGDLQQCADSLLRLRAEWLRETKRPILFHATSGDPLPWSRYAAGERAYETGGRLAWRSGQPATWETWLSALFTWAGTASLAERETLPDTAPDPGDLLVQPGFPGHAVILLDVARSEGETWVLVGQGYMPAQSFHVVPGPNRGWFLWDDLLELDPWPLETRLLRRWRPVDEGR